MLIVPSSVTAPSTITIVFQAGLLQLDLTVVSAISLNVLRRDGTSATWAMTIVSATQKEIVAQYQFTGTGEITGTGVYYLSPTLTVPGGQVPSEAVTMYVSPPFAAQSKVEESVYLAVTAAIPSLGPIKTGWSTPAGPTYTASPYTPWVAVDLRSSALTINLWHAGDGDMLVISDAWASAGLHNMTLNAAAGQNVPTAPGAFGASTVLTASGFVVRLKYNASSANWLPW